MSCNGIRIVRPLLAPMLVLLRVCSGAARHGRTERPRRVPFPAGSGWRGPNSPLFSPYHAPTALRAVGHYVPLFSSALPPCMCRQARQPLTRPTCLPAHTWRRRMTLRWFTISKENMNTSHRDPFHVFLINCKQPTQEMQDAVRTLVLAFISLWLPPQGHYVPPSPPSTLTFVITP